MCEGRATERIRATTTQLHLPVVLLSDIGDNLQRLSESVCISEPMVPLLLADAAIDRFVVPAVDAKAVPFARPVHHTPHLITMDRFCGCTRTVMLHNTTPLAALHIDSEAVSLLISCRSVHAESNVRTVIWSMIYAMDLLGW